MVAFHVCILWAALAFLKLFKCQCFLCTVIEKPICHICVFCQTHLFAGTLKRHFGGIA